MGTEFWRQPAKRLDREFRAYGARRIRRSAAGVEYQFEDGARRFVPSNMTAPNARDMLEDCQRRYPREGAPVFTDVRRAGSTPTIDLTRVSASQHAQERLALMKEQAGVTFQEILVALKAPSKVLWSTRHDSWLWVGDRIAVAVKENLAGAPVITTLLWTSADLWAENPRPR